MSPDPIATIAPEKQEGSRPAVTVRIKVLGVITLLLVAAFAKPVYDLARYSIGSELYSHILLVPAVSLYLIWLKRHDMTVSSNPDRRLAIVLAGSGLLLVSGYWLGLSLGWRASLVDYLSLMTAAFLCFVIGGAALVFGSRQLRPVAFPIAFAIFMVPFPTFLLHWVEAFLQHGSAEVAYFLFKLTGMPLLREGMVFQLPGFSMKVAPQCSGIHSSLVLFITAWVAGHLLLRSPSSRALLAFAVIPLALLRNGLRIFTLGELCVRVSPDFINSPLHHRGGPLFFALSLVPFFLLLVLLRKLENKRPAQSS